MEAPRIEGDRKIAPYNPPILPLVFISLFTVFSVITFSFDLPQPIYYLLHVIFCLAADLIALLLFRNHALAHLFLPAMIISRTRIDPLLEAREAIQKQYPTQWRPVSIRSDGVLLDGAEYRHLRMVDLPPREQRWIIWLNANGMTYEDNISFAIEYARAVGVNLLVFNYKGVGSSQGQTKCAADLDCDGRAVMRYLLDQGVESKHILIHGHSLGGAVGTRVRADYPDGPLINDRSFKSLSSVVGNIFRGFLGAVVAAAIAVLPVMVHIIMGIAGGHWPSMLSYYWRILFVFTSLTFGGILSYFLGLLSFANGIKLHDERKFHMRITLFVGLASGGLTPMITPYIFDPNGWIGCMIGIAELLVMVATTAFGLGLVGVLAPVAGAVVRLLQWDLEVMAAWKKVTGPKAIIYHTKDAIIPYKGASLHEASGNGCNIFEHSFGDGSDQNLLSILNGGGTGQVTHLDIQLMEDEEKLINCHMAQLNSTTAWHYIIPMAQVFLGLPTENTTDYLPETELVDSDHD